LWCVLCVIGEETICLYKGESQAKSGLILTDVIATLESAMLAKECADCRAINLTAFS